MDIVKVCTYRSISLKRLRRENDRDGYLSIINMIEVFFIFYFAYFARKMRYVINEHSFATKHNVKLPLFYSRFVSE